MSTGERILTTVPQQALFMMNSPFVAEQVKNLLARPDFPADGTDEDKVRFIFRSALPARTAPGGTRARDAIPHLRIARAEDLRNDGLRHRRDRMQRTRKSGKKAVLRSSKPLNQWERYTQVVLLTNELIFVN